MWLVSFAPPYHQYLTPLFAKVKSFLYGNLRMFLGFQNRIKPHAVTTYELRPISLTPTVSKILEGFVFKWLTEQVLPHIDPYQSGNVKKCSTTHALIHLIHQACMVDFSKAFDRIDHNILIKQLQILNVHPCLINWCTDFLYRRYLRVKAGSNKSCWKFVHAGVPQGTKLGPLLSLVMINDLKLYFTLYKYVDDCTS